MQIDTSKLTVGEVELIQWQFGGLGSFKKSLWEAITAADHVNMALLERSFPEQVRAYRDFGTTEGYWLAVLTRAGLVKPSPEGGPPEEKH